MPIFLKIMQDIQNILKKHTNRTFLEAVMAACAIVAKADGIVNFAERGRLEHILNIINRLNIFNPQEAIDLFNDYSSNYETNLLIEKIQKLIGHKKEQQLLLNICWDICRVDGKVNKSECDAIEMIADKLCLDFREAYKEF